MQIGVVGINHKLADLKLRELLAKACQRRFSLDHDLNGDQSFVLLSTCNRTEVYFSSSDLVATHGFLLGCLRYDVEEEFDHKLYSFFGQDCFLHLAKVTAGLDSAILGETEIQGQVKIAYETAKTHFSLPFDLHFLFQKGLKVSKEVRHALQIGKGMPDLEHAVLHIGSHFFKVPERARILFIGASLINQKILAFLKKKEIGNITLCNRSIEAAEEISKEYSTQLMDWSQLSDWHQYDWIILATKSPDFLLSQKNLPSDCRGKKLILDLCVPRNVDPLLGKDSRITLLNIDQINRTLHIRKQQMMHELTKAEQYITAESQKYAEQFQERARHRLCAV